MIIRVVVAMLVVAGAILACGGTNPLPETATVEPLKVEQINVPGPSTGDARLTVSFGAGQLRLAPGAEGLVEGTAKYNVEALKPLVVTEGNRTVIKQGEILSLIQPKTVKNAWDLQLGATTMDLSINAGAYEGDFEFGGLALTGLTIKDGASTVNLEFSEPNAAAMTVFRYETGASSVDMTGLANANFSTMLMTSGAGDYTLDFSGELKRDATITLSTGLSNIILVIPEGVPATVTAETGLSNVNAGSSWTEDGDRYTQSGSGPALTFVVKGGLGNLTLTH